MIVIDANIAVSQMITLPFTEPAELRIREWGEAGRVLVAPVLWWYEVVSTMRRAIFVKAISAADAWKRLQGLADLGVEVVPPGMKLHRRALHWAESLGQSRAYDAQYAALAELLGAPLWTADRKLVNGLRAHGVTWAHWIEEPSQN